MATKSLLNRVGETLGLTAKLVDLQTRQPDGNNRHGAGALPEPAGVKERQAQLDQEAEEAAQRAESEKRRLKQLVESTRSLQGELAKAEQRFKGCSEWLENVTLPTLKGHAAAIGETFGTHSFGEFGNPHWIRGLAEFHALLEYRSDILAGNRKVLDEIQGRMAKHIADNRADLETLGFFQTDRIA